MYVKPKDAWRHRQGSASMKRFAGLSLVPASQFVARVSLLFAFPLSVFVLALKFILQHSHVQCKYDGTMYVVLYVTHHLLTSPSCSPLWVLLPAVSDQRGARARRPLPPVQFRRPRSRRTKRERRTLGNMPNLQG